MVLLLWANAYRHDVTIDAGFDLVVGTATGNFELKDAASLIPAAWFHGRLRPESILPASR